MNRLLGILAGPEVALGLLTALVFLFCARHNSYGTEDVRALERLVWQLPLVAVLVAFATIHVPGAKSWTWLARVNIALVACLVAGGFRIVSGFGAPGSGAKGQDAGFILIVTFGVGLSALANAVSVVMILREQKPAFDAWFRLRPVVGSLLTGLAVVPIAVVQTVATCFMIGIVVAALSAMGR